MIIWDLRTSQKVTSKVLHPGGAVNDISHSVSLGLLVSAGADKKIKVSRVFLAADDSGVGSPQVI